MIGTIWYGVCPAIGEEISIGGIKGILIKRSRAKNGFRAIVFQPHKKEN